MSKHPQFDQPIAALDKGAGELLAMLDSAATTAADRAALWNMMPQVKRLMQRIIPDIPPAPPTQHVHITIAVEGAKPVTVN